MLRSWRPEVPGDICRGSPSDKPLRGHLQLLVVIVDAGVPATVVVIVVFTVVVIVALAA